MDLMAAYGQLKTGCTTGATVLPVEAPSNFDELLDHTWSLVATSSG